MNDESTYDVVSVGPNLLNMMNLHTIIYNKKRKNPINLLEGVNTRVPNDTSEIQEEFNTIMVDHLRLEEENKENTVINKYEDDNVDPSSCDNNIYSLLVLDKPICYSKSRMSLLIFGSNMMTEDNEYGTNMDIVKL
jgi:hypothetical protein